ncbi:MAG: endonuclease/exonuclease/phosphatase family protein [Heyndrickxia sp.]
MMNILQYNILDGCQGSDRMNGITNWICRHSFDVIGLNEVNGWTKEQFATLARKWGFDYQHLLRMNSSPYSVGIVSEYPIDVIEEDEKNFYHGLLHVKIRDIHFFIVHFSPEDSIYREKEAQHIVEKIKDLKKEKIIIMGDFNTLSPLDMERYDRENVLERFKKRDGLVRKYLKGNSLNYAPMKILLDTGFHDPAAKIKHNYTIPTELVTSVHGAKLRLDYILVNDLLLHQNPVAGTFIDNDTDRLSDHYPIFCKLTD